MRIRSVICSLVFMIASFSANAQYYDTGQDPAGLKWLQIKTGRFTVIYPEKYGTAGVDFARSLDKAYSDLTTLFPEKKFRIPVIIHSFTTRSNGYVAWAPKRMEIYPTPEQNTIPLDANRQLALHELAHVFQMENINSGLTKALSFIMGQQFPGAIASLLPSWYMEGDAVFAETVLSESGRGRSPGFQKQLKALVTENGVLYKYDKMLNGSFRDYTPDHYQYGYQMIAWSLAGKDPELWNKVLKFTAAEPFTINPVNISLRRNAGLTKKLLFTQTFDSLKTLWNKDITRSHAIKYEPLNPSKKGRFINYYCPLAAGADSVIAIKASLTAPSSFVLLRPSEKSETRLHVPGLVYPYFFSYAGGRLVWIETVRDPRWENREYSVIKLKDLKTGLTSQLTRRSRYMAASISHEGKMIAASENSADNRNSLVLLSIPDGSVVLSVPSPGNASLQRPQWTDDGRKIIVIYLTEAGEGIMSYTLADQSWNVLIEPARNDLQSAFLRNDSLFFISSVSGTDNIYMLAGNKLSEVTSSRFGANDLSINGSSIIFSDYTASGNDICRISAGDIAYKPYEYVKPVSYLIDRIKSEPLREVESNDKSYTPRPYRKWQHLFGFHSWMPFYADIEAIQNDPFSVRPGFTLMSQNQLSTLVSSFGYEYSADRRHKFHSRIIWKGWYPVFESQLDYNNRQIINKMLETVDWIPSPVNRGFTINNSVYIPLIFSSGKFTQNLFPSFSTEYTNSYLYNKAINSYDYGQTQMTGRLYFANYHRSAFRDIYPGWAQVFDLSYTVAPFDKLFYGNDISFKAALYFPGFLRNNSIRLRYETEQQVFGKFLSSNRIHFPRSYSNIVSGKLDFYSVDYTLPLFYPDLNISSLLYVTRIRSALFYDHARGTDNYHLILKDGRLVTDSFVAGPENFTSFGIELLSDFYVLRIPFMITGGVQAAWKAFGEIPSLKLILSVDIQGMTIGRNRM
jgi:hypothetical protein